MQERTRTRPMVREETAGVMRWARGADDAAALEALVRTEYARIRRLAWRFGVPADEIDDAAQEVFARACAAFTGFRGDCAPETWLTRVAVNHFTSRRRTLVGRLRLAATHPATGEQATDGVARHAEQHEAYDRAVACVRRLPVKLRRVFVLRYLEEMTCAEVAETLGIPEATVRTRAYHARKRLRGMMKGYEP